MDTDKVIQLVYNVSHSCQSRETRWEELLQNIHVTRVQVVFASTEAFLSTTLELQETLRSKLKIPSFFFDRMYLQSSSFCGYDVWLDKNEEVEFYSIVLGPLYGKANIRQAPAEEDVHTTHL